MEGGSPSSPEVGGEVCALSCNLCKLVEDVAAGGRPQEVLFQDEIFLVVYCLDHPDTPMAVLKEHTVDPDGNELGRVFWTMDHKYPARKPRGTGMGTIPDHWHEHWVPR